MIRILLIEQSPGDQDILRMILPDDYSLTVCRSDVEGLSVLRHEEFQVLLLEVPHPDSTELSIFQDLRTLPHPPSVVLITDGIDYETVKRSVHPSACIFLEKPFSLTAVLESIESAVKTPSVPSPALLEISEQAAFKAFIGNSLPIRKIKSRIAIFGKSESTVLITGESGTGKEVVARILHEISPRANGPFIALNCGALPESLLETELFGSESGAFTDAVSRPGYLELAEGGTIFLDEIGEMSRTAQVKLLRVLEYREASRVGGRRVRRLNIRVIAATNIDIRQAVVNGTFRSDLYYRINILPVHIPPLRERKEDIPMLVAYLLKEDENTADPPLVHPAVIEMFLEHSWPGNVRELRNVVKRAILLKIDGMIVPESVLFT